MDRLRAALDLWERDGFRAPWEPLVEAARSVLDAPRIWWCEYRKLGREYETADCDRHVGCGWRLLVEEPQ